MLRLAATMLGLLALVACEAADRRIPGDRRLLEVQARAEAEGVFRCNSPGGALLGGVMLGTFLNARHLPAEILPGDTCGSAAAIAVLGAPSLFKSAHGRLLFHGPSRPLTPVERGYIEGSLIRWQVPPAVIARLLALEVDEVWEPDGSELRPVLEARQR